MRYFAFSSMLLTLNLVGCAPTENAGRSPPDEVVEKNVELPSFARVRDLADRATSQDSASSLSFNVPMPHLTEKELELHLAGDVEFNRQFNTESGVGPAFNASSCIICHARDGRGALPVLKPGAVKARLGASESLLLRIGLESENAPGPRLVPGFTEQLFHRGVYSLRPDSPGTGQADVDMSFSVSSFTYPDGRVVELRKPEFTLSNAYDEKVGQPSALQHPDLRISPRMGPAMIGLGLIEAIDERDIVALADPEDEDGDGISGRVHWINGRVGRFGWKATVPSLREQVAAALSNDMGLRNSIFPIENIFGTELFDSFLRSLENRTAKFFGFARSASEKLELHDISLDALEFYVQTLAVPARRDVEVPAVQRGALLFERIGCTGCHTPQFRTSDTASVASLRGLVIYPFSDELLHDMGDQLSDNRTDHEAIGREWKTRPLWGLGLTQTVNPRAGFLHDGRARTIEEAILFHGGEAAKSREKFSRLLESDRQDLLLFLRSL